MLQWIATNLNKAAAEDAQLPRTLLDGVLDHVMSKFPTVPSGSSEDKQDAEDLLATFTPLLQRFTSDPSHPSHQLQCLFQVQQFCHKREFPSGTSPHCPRPERAGVLSSVPWTTFAMRAVGLDDTARTVELEPWDEQVAAALDSWREQVARCTGTYKAPLVRSVARWKAEKPRGHYRFHMTIAYVTFPLGRSNETSEALQRIVGCATPMLQSLGPVICRAPHLCHFSSMAAFHPVTLTDE